MDTPDPLYRAADVAARQREALRRAVTATLALIVLLGAAFIASEAWPGLRQLGVQPLQAAGLTGLLAAPLLHADIGHLLGNAGALLILGITLGTVYPRSAGRIVATAWVGAGLVAWLIGRPSVHLGASGLTHGLFFALFTLGLLRGDRPARVAAFIALLLFGGMALSVLPSEWRISWEMHAGGALAGVLAAWRWRHRDPPPPRPRYSWEIEEDLAGQAEADTRDTLEPPRPSEVPVLWVRPDPPRGVVVPFRRRNEPPAT